VLDYTNVNYSTSLCNVFNVLPLKVVGGLTHYPVSGGVSYNGSALVLQTKGGTTLSTTFGTAFAIGITIKQGYKYSISVNVFRQSNDPVSTPSLEIGLFTTLPNPSSTNPTACGSVNQSKWTVVQAATINGALINNLTPQNYQVVQNYIPTFNYNYITILAHSGSQTQTSTVLIRSITIVETPPSPSFTLPASIPITCGATTPANFTVTNVAGTTGITGYTWNLGSASNGWLHNGSAAPQTISTGTNNTLTLTPICGSTQSNVSATVAVGASNYNTNVATISVTQPTLSITGNAILCSGSGSYTVSGLPCNASVIWDVSPQGIATLGCTNCNTTTLTKVLQGPVTLTATITSSCNLPPVTKTINIGGPQLSISSNTNGCNGSYQIWNLVNNTPNNGTNWNWTVSYLSTPSSQINIYTPSLPSTYVSVTGGGTVSLSYTDLCGAAQTTGVTVYNSGCYGYYRVTVSPNPAKNNMNVSFATANDNQTISNTTEVSNRPLRLVESKGKTVMSLFEVNTTVLVKQWKQNESKNQNYNLNISGLRKGVYVLQVDRDNQTTVTKVLIE
jgi:hypothetical protein